MWSAVWFVAMSFEIVKKHGPKRVAASVDQASRKMLPEHAKAVSLELDDVVLNHGEFRMPRKMATRVETGADPD